MEITKVRVNLGATINLGNFESIRLDYSFEADLISGERSPEEAVDILRECIADKMRDDLLASNGGKDILLKMKK